MIIVSQDKQIIVNFDNVRTIAVVRHELRAYFGSEDYTILETYQTEERAKEILQEIISKYRQWNTDANKAVTVIPKVYEMPKE